MNHEPIPFPSHSSRRQHGTNHVAVFQTRIRVCPRVHSGMICFLDFPKLYALYLINAASLINDAAGL